MLRKKDPLPWQLGSCKFGVAIREWQLESGNHLEKIAVDKNISEKQNNALNFRSLGLGSRVCGITHNV